MKCNKWYLTSAIPHGLWNWTFVSKKYITV